MKSDKYRIVKRKTTFLSIDYDEYKKNERKMKIKKAFRKLIIILKLTKIYVPADEVSLNLDSTLQIYKVGAYNLKF